MLHKLKIFFTKMEGIGNDYIYVDSLDTSKSVRIPEKTIPDLARKISDRHFGVGSDGLIMIAPSTDADFCMRIFNADGSEAQMCGNGIRCVGKYVYDKGFTTKTDLRIKTLAGIKTLHLNVENEKVKTVTVDMGRPYLKRKDIPVSGTPTVEMISEKIYVDGKEIEVTAVGMGNPHCVVFKNEISDEDILVTGPEIETHEKFPEKTNVEFIKIVDRENIVMRVWERGSGETLACGTGACAATVASFLNGYTGRKVTVHLKGGELFIEYDSETGHIFMTGPANTICEGEFIFRERVN